MRTLIVLVTWLTLTLPSDGQSAAENELPPHAIQLAEVLAGNWQEEMYASVTNVLEGASSGYVRDQLEIREADFRKSFSWEKARQQIANALTRRYNEEELAQLHAFFTSDLGKKFAGDRATLRSEIMTEVVLMRQRLPVLRQMDAELKKLLDKLSGKERDAIEQAMKATPFGSKLVVGKWYADDRDGDGNGYLGWMELGESGISRVLGVEVNHAKKEYSKYDDHGAWRIQGRLLMIADFEYPELPRFYIIHSVSPERLDYTFVVEDLKMDEWEKLSDGRKPIDLPSKPAGYTDPSE